VEQTPTLSLGKGGIKTASTLFVVFNPHIIY